MKNLIFQQYRVGAIAMLFTLFFCTVSCNKSFLDTSPYGVVTDESFFLNEEQGRGAVMQCYNRTIHLGPIYLFIRHALNEYAGSDLLRTQTDDFTAWNNFSPDNVQFLWGWKYCFQGIYLCNYTINKLNGSPIPDDVKDKLIAECKAIRGLMHYMVAARYGQSPVITDILPIEQYYEVAFSDAEAIYNQVIIDFQEAIPHLPKSWDVANKGRISQAATKMMLAKTYMQLAGYPINKTENWQKAADVLAEFVPMDKRSEYDLELLPDYGNVYDKAFEQSRESVLEVNHMYYAPGANIGVEVGAPGNFYQAFAHPQFYEGTGNGRECFTADLYDEFEKDINGDIIDRRYTYTMLEPGDVFYITTRRDTLLHNSVGRVVIENVRVDAINNVLTYDIKEDTDRTFATWKWPGKNNEWYPNYKYMRNAHERTGLLNNAPVTGEDLNLKWLRFSDAILNYAECLNEVGRTQEAVPYVNEVRQRANNTASIDPHRVYQKTIVTGTLPMIDLGISQGDLREAIQHESRVELAGEDWSYENLRRWGIAQEKLHQMAAKSPGVGQATVNPASRYVKGQWDYFPVPSNEYRP